MNLKSLLFVVALGRKLQFSPNGNLEGPLSEDCQVNAYPAERVLYQPKTHIVNLDLPPEQRWVEMGKLYWRELGTTLKVLAITNF